MFQGARRGDHQVRRHHLKETTTALDGLITTRIDGARSEFNLDVEQIHADLERCSKEDIPCKQASSSTGKEVGGNRDSTAADPLGFDKFHRGKAHQVYVPPPVRGARESVSPRENFSPREFAASDVSDLYQSAPRVELPRFDGSNPQLWQSR